MPVSITTSPANSINAAENSLIIATETEREMINIFALIFLCSAMAAFCIAARGKPLATPVFLFSGGVFLFIGAVLVLVANRPVFDTIDPTPYTELHDCRFCGSE